MRSCASLSRRCRGPAGLRDLFYFCQNCDFYALRTQGLSACARRGWYHYPRRALRVAETLDDRLSKWFICRFLASPMQFLAEAMDSAIHAGLGDKYYELQVEFHNVYLDRYPNTEMTDLLKRLENNFIRNYYLFENPDNENSVLEETNQQHYEIIRLFREKKPAELAQYIRDVHWDSSKAKCDSLPSQHM